MQHKEELKKNSADSDITDESKKQQKFEETLISNKLSFEKKLKEVDETLKQR